MALYNRLCIFSVKQIMIILESESLLFLNLIGLQRTRSRVTLLVVCPMAWRYGGGSLQFPRRSFMDSRLVLRIKTWEFIRIIKWGYGGKVYFCPVVGSWSLVSIVEFVVYAITHCCALFRISEG